MAASFTILIGTTKGAFLLDSDADRRDWRLTGPFCENWGINHMIGDPESGSIWAGGGDEFSGAGIWRSEDHGESWVLCHLSHGQREGWIAENPDMAAEMGIIARPPAPFTGQFSAIWSLGLAGGTLYAGAKPATLLASSDGGLTWAIRPALSEHPSRESWQPGAAGLTLHTIVAAPGRPDALWLGVSAAGVFASDDGGASWDRRNRRANTDAGAGEVGACVHNMVRAPGQGGDRLYQQNHHGVFRSDDGGRNWREIGGDLPSTFGFPIAVHPRDPDTVWTLPLNGDSLGRYPPDARPAIWRSRDGGESWAAQRAGLPERDCYFTVLRQAMATDHADPAGLYFGTNTGSLFASRDEGESWDEIARHLPTILSVETLQRAG